MKNLIALVTILFATLFFVGCSNNDTPTSTPTPPVADVPQVNDPVAPPSEIGEIVVVNPAAQHGWMAGVLYFAEEAGRELGLSNFRILTSSNFPKCRGHCFAAAYL
jgi:ABC-type sugar transport system substrate-binding protein